MGANVVWREEDGLIVVHEFDEVTEDDFHRSVDEICRLGELHGGRSVLVDTRRMTTATSVPNLYERAAYAAPRFQMLSLRVAILVAEPLAKPHEFFEDVAVNRGSMIEVFHDESSALAWLRSE